MRKLILLTIMLLISNNIYPQEGIFKIGNVETKKYNNNVDYEIIEDVIIVSVNINNKAYRFLLDTGAPTVINKELSEQFEVIAGQEIEDASGNSEVLNFVQIPELIIAGVEFNNFIAMSSDIAVLDEFNADGILGANLISKSIWDFDLENNSIIISDKIYDKTIKSFQKSKIKLLDTGSPIIEINHSGAVDEEIYIDFGFNGLFSLAHNTFTVLKDNNLLSNSIEGKGEFAQTAFGKAIDTTYYKTVLDIKINKANIEPIIADVDYDEESSIGSEWLKFYRTILTKKRFYFKRNSTKMQTNFKSNGMETVFRDNKLIINFIWNNSEACLKGIELGDEILSVNKISVLELNQDGNNNIDDQLNSDKVLLEINTKGNFVELNKKEILKTKPKLH